MGDRAAPRLRRLRVRLDSRLRGNDDHEGGNDGDGLAAGGRAQEGNQEVRQEMPTSVLVS